MEYQLYGNRTPEKIYGGNTESVTVTLNDLTGTITIDADDVTSGTTFTKTEGFNADDELTFTFSDRYYRSYGFMGGDWQDADTYTATCTVAELIEGTATLKFAR